MPLETVSLGSTGLSVSELAFGTWRFAKETDQGTVEVRRGRAYELLDAYAEAGGNFIDTADVYGGGIAEEIIGDWMAARDREAFVIASKIYWPTDPEDPNAAGLNRRHLRRGIDRILDRLDTDYLDLLYIHRWDDATPARELMRTLAGLVDDGRVNYLGTSTKVPNAWRVAQANEIARREGWEPFTVAQPRYNLVDREIEGNYLDMSREYGIGICPWSPLGWGFLTGKYERGAGTPEDSTAAEDDRFETAYLTEENFDALEVLRAVAEEVGATPAQVAIAWLAAKPTVTAPIIGARTVEQLEENIAAADVSLSPDQLARLDDAK